MGSITGLIVISVLTLNGGMSVALPPPSDIPEEILRTDIIVEGRSSLNNEPLTPGEKELLREALQDSKFPPQINPKIRNLIFLLQIRNAIRKVIPIF